MKSGTKSWSGSFRTEMQPKSRSSGFGTGESIDNDNDRVRLGKSGRPEVDRRKFFRENGLEAVWLRLAKCVEGGLASFGVEVWRCLLSSGNGVWPTWLGSLGENRYRWRTDRRKLFFDGGLSRIWLRLAESSEGEFGFVW